jgi:hypothetical protein
MTKRTRVALKIVWMWMLAGTLVLLGQVRYEFIYRAF